jgi:hypothetical protein
MTRIDFGGVGYGGSASVFRSLGLICADHRNFWSFSVLFRWILCSTSMYLRV